MFSWREYSDNIIISKYTRRFIESRLHIREVQQLNEILPSDYDCIIVGSDQVWRKVYFSPVWQTTITDAFLQFAEKWSIKRISYAASFGLDEVFEYSKEELVQCSKLLSQFDGVSVREKSGINLCKHCFSVEAQKMPDPTLLLPQRLYLNLIKNNIQKANLFYYVLDKRSEILDFIDSVCQQNHWTSHFVNADVYNRNISAKKRVQRPIEDWLSGLFQADAVVTDSYHACIFSIIFNVPFIVFGNQSRGADRFTSLLEDFGMIDRLVTDISQIDDHTRELLHVKPDAQAIISRLRETALAYLNRYLS